MSHSSARARKWTCDQCGVSASQADGKLAPLPDTWASSADGLFCLVCRRERAADAALEAAPSDSPLEARARLRRTPDHTDGAIAKACRTSVSTVTKARSGLQPIKHPEPAGR